MTNTNDTTKPERPAFVEDEHLEYLDELRESGVTNMLGGASCLRDSYPALSKRDAREILTYWMQTFGRDDR